MNRLNWAVIEESKILKFFDELSAAYTFALADPGRRKIIRIFDPIEDVIIKIK